MSHYRRFLIGFLLIAIASLTNVQQTKATTTNFTVKGGEEETRTIRLAMEDRVLIRFTVVGQYGSTLNFYITYPNTTVREFGKTGDFHYSFVCDAEGDHILHFSNVDSTDDKLVTLDYEITRYIFGIPQMLFLALVIAVICVVAVAAFILLGKTH